MNPTLGESHVPVLLLSHTLILLRLFFFRTGHPREYICKVCVAQVQSHVSGSFLQSGNSDCHFNFFMLLQSFVVMAFNGTDCYFTCTHDIFILILYFVFLADALLNVFAPSRPYFFICLKDHRRKL